VGIGALVLSLLVLRPTSLLTDLAGLYAAWFMSLVIFLAFGLLVMMPITLVVIVCWVLLARRLPHLERSFNGIAAGSAAVALAMALMVWAVRSASSNTGGAVFPVAWLLASWVGLFLPRRLFSYLRPGCLLAPAPASPPRSSAV